MVSHLPYTYTRKYEVLGSQTYSHNNAMDWAHVQRLESLNTLKSVFPKSDIVFPISEVVFPISETVSPRIGRLRCHGHTMWC